MSLLNPWALLLLLSVPALVLLYFLKLKRPPAEVPSTLLWQKVVEDMRVNSPFQRLRRSLLLLLQLLALLAAIAALSRPMARRGARDGESFIVLLDNSASMAAREADGRTRLDLARAELRALAAGLGRGDEMMLIVFSTDPDIACPFTRDRRALQAALAAVRATDCPTDAAPALALARSIANTRPRPRVLLLSDGAFPAPAGAELPVDLEYRMIGTPRPNLAVTGLDVRRSLRDRRRIEMFVAVENFGDRAFAGNMTVHLDDTALDAKYVSVGPGETLSQVFEALLPAGGNIRVALDVDDALACDNRAWRTVPPPAARRVLLVGRDTFFLERAFAAAPGVDGVDVARGADPAPAQGYAAVVWHAVPAPGVAPCDNIYLGCAPALPGLALGPPIEAPGGLDWDTAHPVNRFLDYANLVIAETAAMTLPDQAVTVVRAAGTPLVALLETPAGGACLVGFSPMKSNWPLLVSFPLFLSNCLDGFDAQRARRLPTNLAVGRPIVLPAALADPVLRLPDGTRAAMTRAGGGAYVFTGARQAGIYRVETAGDGASESFAVAANLFDRDESALAPVAEPLTGKVRTRAVEGRRLASREYWRALVAAVLAVLALEWIVYQRRLFV